MKELRLVSTFLLSIILIFSISTAVFADNEIANEEINDIWSDVSDVNVENSVTNDLETDLENSESLFEDVEVENEEDNDVWNEGTEENEEEDEEYNNLYNSTASNSENLAQTGLEDSTGIMALIITISAVVAIYSAKRINEYNNL